MRISPSKLQAWATCPCFEYKTQTDAANEGTLLHEAIANKDPSKLEDVDQIEQWQKMMDIRKVFEDRAGPGAEIYVELPVEITQGVKGTLDFAVLSKALKRVDIIDWKTGRLGVPVEAKNSYQLGGYAVGFVRKFEGALEGIEVVAVHFIAPRTNEVDTHEYKFGEINDIVAELDKLIAIVDNPFKTPCNSSPRLCASCSNAARCPLVCKALTPLAQQALMTPTLIDLVKPIDELSPEELSQHRALADLASEFFEQRQKTIAARVINEGIDIPGYRLVEKAGSLKITNVKDAFDILCANGIDRDTIVACMDIKIAQLRKEIPEVDTMLEPVTNRGQTIRYLQRQRTATAKQLLLGKG